MFAVRVVTTDHYQATPIKNFDVCYSDFRATEVRKVPVIRIYGSTPAGQKTCLHVHGVFPYFYIKYDGTQPIEKYLRQLASSIDKAVNVALGNAASTQHHVYKISLVTGIPFYGYHSHEEQFLKIYLYNPNMVRKVSDLLLGGAVMNKPFQPHETHIPFLLQFFIDYNLYGMNLVHLAAVKFRRISGENIPIRPSSSSGLSPRSSGSKVWKMECIHYDALMPPEAVRQSTCELEVDVVAADILNRFQVHENLGSNPGLNALWEDEKQRREERGDTTPLETEESQDRGRIPPTDSELGHLERLHQIIRQQLALVQSQLSSSPDNISSSLPCTQSGHVEIHQSQFEVSNTPPADEDADDDVEPVVNERSIRRVLSCSQSFLGDDGNASQLLGDTQDQNLVQMLAMMANDADAGSSDEDASPVSSQVLSQIPAMEEKDSILHGTPLEDGDDDDAKDEEENLVMSQELWDQFLDPMSQEMIDVPDEDNCDTTEEDIIPQIDGAGDEKDPPSEVVQKRLGARGPVIQRGTRGDRAKYHKHFALPFTNRSYLKQSKNIQQQSRDNMQLNSRDAKVQDDLVHASHMPKKMLGESIKSIPPMNERVTKIVVEENVQSELRQNQNDLSRKNVSKYHPVQPLDIAGDEKCEPMQCRPKIKDTVEEHTVSIHKDNCSDSVTCANTSIGQKEIVDNTRELRLDNKNIGQDDRNEIEEGIGKSVIEVEHMEEDNSQNLEVDQEETRDIVQISDTFEKNDGDLNEEEEKEESFEDIVFPPQINGPFINNVDFTNIRDETVCEKNCKKADSSLPPSLLPQLSMTSLQKHSEMLGDGLGKQLFVTLQRLDAEAIINLAKANNLKLELSKAFKAECQNKKTSTKCDGQIQEQKSRTKNEKERKKLTTKKKWFDMKSPNDKTYSRRNRFKANGDGAYLKSTEVQKTPSPTDTVDIELSQRSWDRSPKPAQTNSDDEIPSTFEKLLDSLHEDNGETESDDVFRQTIEFGKSRVKSVNLAERLILNSSDEEEHSNPPILTRIDRKSFSEIVMEYDEQRQIANSNSSSSESSPSDQRIDQNLRILPGDEEIPCGQRTTVTVVTHKQDFVEDDPMSPPPIDLIVDKSSDSEMDFELHDPGSDHDMMMSPSSEHSLSPVKTPKSITLSPRMEDPTENQERLSQQNRVEVLKAQLEALRSEIKKFSPSSQEKVNAITNDKGRVRRNKLSLKKKKKMSVQNDMNNIKLDLDSNQQNGHCPEQSKPNGLKVKISSPNQSRDSSEEQKLTMETRYKGAKQKRWDLRLKYCAEPELWGNIGNTEQESNFHRVQPLILKAVKPMKRTNRRLSSEPVPLKRHVKRSLSEPTVPLSNICQVPCFNSGKSSLHINDLKIPLRVSESFDLHKIGKEVLKLQKCEDCCAGEMQNEDEDKDADFSVVSDSESPLKLKISKRRLSSASLPSPKKIFTIDTVSKTNKECEHQTMKKTNSTDPISPSVVEKHFPCDRHNEKMAPSLAKRNENEISLNSLLSTTYTPKTLNDYDSEFTDVMYNLALLSPASLSDSDISIPEPLSPSGEGRQNGQDIDWYSDETKEFSVTKESTETLCVNKNEKMSLTKGTVETADKIGNIQNNVKDDGKEDRLRHVSAVSNASSHMSVESGVSLFSTESSASANVSMESYNSVDDCDTQVKVGNTSAKNIAMETSENNNHMLTTLYNSPVVYYDPRVKNGVEHNFKCRENGNQGNLDKFGKVHDNSTQCSFAMSSSNEQSDFSLAFSDDYSEEVLKQQPVEQLVPSTDPQQSDLSDKCDSENTKDNSILQSGHGQPIKQLENFVCKITSENNENCDGIKKGSMKQKLTEDFVSSWTENLPSQKSAIKTNEIGKSSQDLNDQEGSKHTIQDDTDTAIQSVDLFDPTFEDGSQNESISGKTSIKDGKLDTSPSQSQEQKAASDSVNSKGTQSERQLTKNGSGQVMKMNESENHNQTSEKRCILTPLKPPPDCAFVSNSLVSMGIDNVQGQPPYYSNPEDVPEKVRDTGSGAAMMVHTTLVKDIPEFESSSGLKTLNQWQADLGFCSSNRRNGSAAMNDSFDLMAEMARNPQLRTAVLGDRHVVLTPVKEPPSGASIKTWFRKKEKRIKNKTHGAISGEDQYKQDLEPKVDNKGTFICTEKIPKVSHLSNFKNERDMDVKERTVSPKIPCSDTRWDQRKRIKFDNEDTELNSAISRSAHTLSVSTPCSNQAVVRRDLDGLKTQNSPISPLTICTGNTPSTSSIIHHSTPMASTSHPVSPRRLTPIPTPICTPITAAQGKRTRFRDRIEVADHSQTKGATCMSPPCQRDLKASQSSPPNNFKFSATPVNTPHNTHVTSPDDSPCTSKQFVTPANRKQRLTSQIEGPTLDNTFGFKHSQHNLQEVKAYEEPQFLTILSMEVHAASRGDLRPDPEVDKICAIFYHILNDVPGELPKEETGVFIVDKHSCQGGQQEINGQPSTSHNTQGQGYLKNGRSLLQKTGVAKLKSYYVKDEKDLLEEFIKFVHKWDPDIFVGYEIQMLSWGYLLQRAAHLDVDLCTRISRIPASADKSHFSSEKDEWGADYNSEIHVGGRIVLNLWRILRHEVTLNIYGFENVAYHVLHRRIPLYSFRSLTTWFAHRTDLYRWRTVEHYVTRARCNVEIMEQLDLIGRTSEFARVFGIEFYHVLSRGSQYRVESMMLRLAKPMNFIPVSPSVQQRARMKAPECIPLTLEPESKFYHDPVVVLDFQSLYPSIMIAYNYCFSTCLGRLNNLAHAHEGEFDFGCTGLRLNPSLLKKMEKDVTVSPNGVVFAKHHVRKGIISSMVEEILNTRIMVKKSMKAYKGNKALERLLHARQLGLKLIANVTFGYTSASFSGRMPCVEIGDSIVAKARETLERAIQLVESTPKWGARVVYGDTDSMFILMKGRTKDQAFRIGQEIADAVTAANPKPIKLKFEKVYLPCVLQTKKRYVGFMYETPDQVEPVFDAKGIETVRRDTCSAVAKILERSIKLLFTTKDVSEVKKYVQRQCLKLLEGKASVQDCILAKEYRGMAGYRPGACVPALEISKKMLAADRRSEPRVGERVPYIIVYGSPGLPLIQLVRRPLDLMLDPNLRLNATYYITKQILPPLDRIFSLMRVDVFSWYHELPRVNRALLPVDVQANNKKGTISQYFSTINCPICDELTQAGVCHKCQQDPQLVVTVLNTQIRGWERTQSELKKICFSCMGYQDFTIDCISLDCPVMYRRIKAEKEVAQAGYLRGIKDSIK